MTDFTQDFGVRLYTQSSTLRSSQQVAKYSTGGGKVKKERVVSSSRSPCLLNVDTENSAASSENRTQLSVFSDSVLTTRPRRLF